MALEQLDPVARSIVWALYALYLDPPDVDWATRELKQAVKMLKERN